MKSKGDLYILDFVDEFGGITIEQAKLMFYNTKYGYDTAKRRLKKLVEENYLKVAKDFLTQKNVYYSIRKPSSHKIILLDLYSKLSSLTETEVIYFEPEYTIQNKRADAMLVIKSSGVAKMLLVEVDINNKTKEDKYLNIYNSGELQSKYGAFPLIVIIEKQSIRKRKIKKMPFSVIRFCYEMKDIEKIV